jgi:uncharacterized membrane protein YdjX (TVP38/TMEM64 family)
LRSSSLPDPEGTTTKGTEDAKEEERAGGRWRTWVAFALLVAGLCVLVLVVWPLRARLGELVERSRGLDEGYVFLFAALYLPFSALGLPGTWVTIFCCLVFGFWPTFPAIVLASNLGAALAFLLGRTLLRERVHAWLAARPKPRAVERAIGEESFRLVFLLRLTPLVPFNALNYLLGVTPIRFGPYALATFVGMLPGTLLNCTTLASMRDLAPLLAGELPPDPLGVAGLVARIVLALLASWLVARRARKALRESMSPP